MAGALCIVSIPTESYEKKLTNKPRKLFERTSTADPCCSYSPEVRPSTPSSDAEYGTFTKVNYNLFKDDV